jgi:hypothetical protein
MRLLAKLHQKHGNHLTMHLFGCESENADFQRLEHGFPFQNHGPLLRPQVAHLLGQSDLFIDLSDYQAFGRTALEAMACGCAAVVPTAGGADEYAVHDVNALVVNTLDEEASFKTVSSVLASELHLGRLQYEGLLTAARYSVHGAAVSEWLPMYQALKYHRKSNRVVKRDRSVVIWASPPRADNLIECRQSLLLDPLASSFILKSLRTIVVSEMGKEPPQADIYVIDFSQEQPDIMERLSVSNEIMMAGKKVVAYVETTDQQKPEEWADHLEKVGRVSHIMISPVAASVTNKRVRVIPSRCSTIITPAKSGKGVVNTHVAVVPKIALKIGIVGPQTSPTHLALLESALAEILKDQPCIVCEWIGVYQEKKVPFGKRIGLAKKRGTDSFVQWLTEVADWDIAIVIDDPIYLSPSVLDRRMAEYLLISKTVLCPKKWLLMSTFPDNDCIEFANETTTAGWLAGLERSILRASKYSGKCSLPASQKIENSNKILANFYLEIFNEN